MIVRIFATILMKPTCTKTTPCHEQAAQMDISVHRKGRFPPRGDSLAFPVGVSPAFIQRQVRIDSSMALTTVSMDR